MKSWEENEKTSYRLSDIESQKQKNSFSFSDEESKRAASKAMNLLLHKDRTRSELAGRLEREGFSGQASREAMEYVEHFGYINDQRYVENYLMFQKGKRSRREIVYKLSEKGISDELIRQVMEETEYQGEEEAIESLIRRRLKGKRTENLSYEEKSKVFAYLGRKGYEMNTVKKVFSKLDNQS